MGARYPGLAIEVETASVPYGTSIQLVVNNRTADETVVTPGGTAVLQVIRNIKMREIRVQLKAWHDRSVGYKYELWLDGGLHARHDCR